jgi:ABC-2 type transport system ATP-binding protein
MAENENSSTGPEPAVHTRGLCHTYTARVWERRRTALDGLDLSVGAGEIFGYLGANGAGKTTTIKLLVGLLHPAAGSAFLFGRDARDPEARRRVGFMPENPYFYEYLTAAESLDFYGALADVPRAERKTRAGELLEFVGLSDTADVRLREFSKGMRQRLGIAQALVNRPGLVILDEPMSGLDPVGRRQVREAILELRRGGATVFFSTHILSDVELICDRVGLLVKGKLTACGAVRDLLHARAVAYEVGGESIPPEARDKIAAGATGAVSDGTETVFTFAERGAAERAVEAIAACGGRLSLFRPVRESLEAYFMREMGLSGDAVTPA